MMRKAAVNIAIRWFAGDGLTKALSDHSSPTGIRQRRGGSSSGGSPRAPLGLAWWPASPGARWGIGGLLVRADGGWNAIARLHADAVQAANSPAKPVCRTEPEATGCCR